MKVLVTYLSQTGNTKKVADAIFGEIKGDKEMKTLETTSDLNGYDLAFVGFPVWSSGPAEPAKKFLEAHAPRSADARVSRWHTSELQGSSCPGSAGRFLRLPRSAL